MVKDSLGHLTKTYQAPEPTEKPGVFSEKTHKQQRNSGKRFKKNIYIYRYAGCGILRDFREKGAGIRDQDPLFSP